MWRPNNRTIVKNWQYICFICRIKTVEFLVKKHLCKIKNLCFDWLIIAVIWFEKIRLLLKRTPRSLIWVTLFRELSSSWKVKLVKSNLLDIFIKQDFPVEIGSCQAIDQSVIDFKAETNIILSSFLPNFAFDLTSSANSILLTWAVYTLSIHRHYLRM